MRDVISRGLFIHVDVNCEMDLARRMPFFLFVLLPDCPLL
jgi:hypothetical protein